MDFGEKLFKLRKENGFSQERLAEKLNTSRQAISKWENGDGFPETEKLLMIGNIFEVSIDYLLKETDHPSQKSNKGYYVSKEMAEGYLLNRNKFSNNLAAGSFVIALAFIPYFFFKQDPTMYALPTIIIAALGVGIIVSAYSLEESQYKILKQEHLMFDEIYLKELKARYEKLKTKYAAFMLVGTCLLIIGLLPLLFEKKGITSGFFIKYYPISIALIAIGVFILTRLSTILNAYKLLANNEEHINRMHFKIVKKIKKKIDEI